MRLPTLLVGLLGALLLAVLLWPRGDTPGDAGDAAGEAAGRRGDTDSAGDTIRAVTARIAEFQHRIDELAQGIGAGRKAREELSRRIAALEERPAAAPRPAAQPNARGDSFGTLTRSIDHLQQLAADPIGVGPPVPAADIPVGMGFDPVADSGLHWIGPDFRPSLLGDKR